MTGSILFVGDIHDKESVVCPAIEHHMSERAVGTVVLLGDLLNDWTMSAKGEINEFRVLHDHVQAWRRNGIDVRVLLGNHDVIYLTPPRSRDRYRLKAVSPGYRADAHETIRPMLMGLEPQVAYGVELAMVPGERQVLCTHAGVTNDWVEWCDHVLDSQPEETTAVGLSDWLNQLFHEHPRTFMERVGVARGGGYRRGVSPLWADKIETEREPRPHDIIQIVGHTPVTTITPVSYSPAYAYPSIWYCDTMSDDSHGNHLGDGTMLLYDARTGRFDILEWPEHIERNA